MSSAVRWFRAAPGLQRAIVVVAAVVAGVILLASLGRILEGVAIALFVLLGLAFLAVPFVLIGFAIYGVAQLIKGRDSRAASGAGAPSAPSAPSGFVGDDGGTDGPTRPDTGSGVAAAEVPAPGVALPAELAAQVARIRDKARTLQAPEQSALLSVDDRQRIESMLGDFLPQALQTYSSLPKGSHDWEVDGDGTTPRQVLDRHLKLIEDGLDAIARRVFEAGAAELVAQGKFLEETLRARGGEELSLNGTSAAAPVEPKA